METATISFRIPKNKKDIIRKQMKECLQLILNAPHKEILMVSVGPDVCLQVPDQLSLHDLFALLDEKDDEISALKKMNNKI